MNKNTKVLIGAALAFALTAGIASAAPAQAFGINLGGSASAGSGSASASADAHAGAGIHGGLRGAVQSFFSRDKDREMDNDMDDNGDHQERKLDDRLGLTFGIGTVTAVNGSVITATAKNDPSIVWAINTDSNTKFAYKGNSTVDVGDRIAVAGNVTDNDGTDRAINASYVLSADANLAALHGTITAVDSGSNTVTVATKHQGDVTVAVDSSTTINDRDGDTGVFSDLVVGTKVRVKGLWNSVHDLVTAAKVRIEANL